MRAVTFQAPGEVRLDDVPEPELLATDDAIVELRRVAGKQLDARFVEIFIELLEGKDVSFQHGEAADFEKELALEARIEETASPAGEKSRFQVAGVN